MAENVLSGVANYLPAATTIKTAIIYLFFGLLFAGIIVLIFYWLLYLKRTIKIIEIDYITKRIKMRRGRIKLDKGENVFKLLLPSLKKKLKRPQQQDIFLSGTKDVLFLLKDNNGLHHTLRLPTHDEIIGFYNSKNINITTSTIKDNRGKDIENPHYSLWQMLFMPNPHEDIEWLANQCIESDREYTVKVWWQHPNVALIGTAFVCFLMIFVTVFFRNKA